MSTQKESFFLDLSQAPLPTERTLRLRKSLPYQFLRFVISNLKLAYLTLFKK